MSDYWYSFAWGFFSVIICFVAGLGFIVMGALPEYHSGYLWGLGVGAVVVFVVGAG